MADPTQFGDQTNMEAEQRRERDQIAALAAEFSRFFREDESYKKRIGAMVAESHTRLPITLNDLRRVPNRQNDRPLPNKLLDDPTSYIQPLEMGVQRCIKDTAPQFLDKMENQKIYSRVAFEGAFGSHDVNPRSLKAHLVAKLVRVQGIVTKCSLVRPKVVLSTYTARPGETADGYQLWPSQFVPTADNLKTRVHRDDTALTKHTMVGDNPVPHTDSEGHTNEVEYGLSIYKDYQQFTVQEMPEHAPTGQLPRSVDVIAEEDLVDRVKPGDRVKVTGVYRAMCRRDSTTTSGIFRTVLILTNVEQLHKEKLQPATTPLDITNIEAIAGREDLFELAARSFAPSICGRELVKRGMLLLLLGGVERNLENGSHIRGDIHLLMIGDPSCGKSQLLRFLLNIAPLAISTTGRGASGVGLTAAVTMDKDTSERRLEAGAMVLADRGIVCIDEFDKMSPADRVAIHEVMEQQTVTIAKAGIHATLNARCSVVAAANPLYGHFSEEKELSQQIAFQETLLSRFDLIFIVRDVMDETEDRRIARHVIQQGRLRREGDEAALRRGGAVDMGNLQGGAMMEGPGGGGDDENGNENDNRREKTSKPFEDAGNVQHHRDRNGDVPEFLTLEFLQKYIHYAKVTFKPKLTPESVELIQDAYAEMREKFNRNPTGRSRSRRVVVTTRTLEALIRLSTAHAKLRLSDEVTKVDVDVALRLVLHTLGGDVDDDEQMGEGEGEGDENMADEDDEQYGEDDEHDYGDLDSPGGERGSPKRPRRRLRKSTDRRKPPGGGDGEDDEQDDKQDDGDDQDQQQQTGRQRQQRRQLPSRRKQQDDLGEGGRAAKQRRKDGKDKKKDDTQEQQPEPESMDQDDDQQDNNNQDTQISDARFAELQKGMEPVHAQLEEFQYHSFADVLRMLNNGRRRRFTAGEFEAGIERLGNTDYYMV
ncbi:unnamed protein product [Vitrella brassicaformis CCMP3155]|uniref:DNA replication licensing factor MCM3 n=1 Tax=Vitrella brassicaformis (strain CCMP3155) TaxID=1169540 RepID=A0A0G4G1B0_VITBC|nr:unnamed protein product [Vitrella brassicaformis CCMP3155]|eukprot:CEM21778.1 unnamed protein product [Vitrella brassicaformis CCMP3155]